MNLKLDQIEIKELEVRQRLDEDTVEEYAEAFRDPEVTMPPIVVFHDGVNYFLADGFHRFHAAKRAGLVDIEADIREGTRREALLCAVGCNNEHGLRRSNEDKRKAVSIMLQDDEWRRWSDRQIAKACNVGHPLVAEIRSSLTGRNSSEESETRTYTTKHGTVATMNTERIGKRAIEAILGPGPVRDSVDPAPAYICPKCRSEYPATHSRCPHCEPPAGPPSEAPKGFDEGVDAVARKAFLASPPSEAPKVFDERPCIGLHLARLAIMRLEEIRKNDRERKEAFDLVRRWLDEAAQ